MSKLKFIPLSISISFGLMGCGGGSEVVSVAPNSIQVSSQEVLTLEQAAALKSVDNSIPPGHARYIVQLNPSVVDAAAAEGGQSDPVSAIGLKIKTFQSGLAMEGLRVVYKESLPTTNSFITEVPVENQVAFVSNLKSNPGVLAVIPDQVVTTNQTTQALSSNTVNISGLSSFPYPSQYWWYLDRIDQRALPLDSKYTNTYTAKNVKAYVMDTGISAHTEIASKLPGYSAISDAYGTTDCNGHGTAVASQIAGVNIGVAPGTPVVPVRVMGCTGSGLVSDILKGFDWILANGTLPSVVNMSFGTAALPLADAYVQKLINRGFNVVVAAGNAAKDACSYSPARVSTAITVGASNNLDYRSSFSNYGSCISLFAPGEAVMAASYSNPSLYVLANGTSFSAPITAGVVSLILQQKPKWAPSSVKSQLIAQSTKSVIKNSASANSNLAYAIPSSLATTANALRTYVYSMTASKTAVTSTTWKRTITVQLKTDANTNPAGISVLGYFSNSSTPVTCVTGTTGACAISSSAVANSVTPAYTVDTLSAAGYIYAPSLNKVVYLK